MITVNLFDHAFAHNICSVHGKTPKHIQYVRNRRDYRGITLITDDMIDEPLLRVLNSDVTIGWLLEPREYKPENYERAFRNLDRLDLLLTHDLDFIDGCKDPKVRWVPFGGCWIKQENWGRSEKSAGVCQIMSGKDFMPGHRLRHEVARRFPQVDCYGWGSSRGRLEEKDAVLKAHRFCVVIENSRIRGFFTEKLLDCFATQTIPIYWGAPDIGKYFSASGILSFETIDELVAILARLDPPEIDMLMGISAAMNLALMKPYEITEDWICTNILETLISDSNTGPNSSLG